MRTLKRNVKESVTLNSQINSYRGLEQCFSKIDDGDKFAKNGNWSIGLGGYDKGYVIMFRGQEVFRVNYDLNEFEVMANLSASEIKEISRIMKIDEDFTEIKPSNEQRNSLRMRKARKNESVGNKRWFVLDLNTTEECDSLEDAIDKAEWWIQNQKDILEDADDEEVARWYRAGDRGLDTGDVEIYEVDADDEDILDYNGRASVRKIISKYDPVEVFSGFAVTEKEAEKRKL